MEHSLPSKSWIIKQNFNKFYLWRLLCIGGGGAERVGKRLFFPSCHFLTFLVVKPLVMSLQISDKAVKFLLRSIKLSFLSNYFASKTSKWVAFRGIVTKARALKIFRLKFKLCFPLLTAMGRSHFYAPWFCTWPPNMHWSMRNEQMWCK